MPATANILSNPASHCDIHDSACYAETEGLRYVTDQTPGYSRKLKGKHFIFFDKNQRQIKDPAEIARIRKLAIPPAYKDVWISPYANGHLQATGIDARGRKQYRYHERWRSVRDASKFHHILAFGDVLPLIRSTVDTHRSQRGLTREKVLATVITLLEKTMIRVGNSEYAKSNQSYGLTTLRENHIDLTGETIHFNFKGKSGKEWKLKLTDRRIARVIRQCEEIEGQELFKYESEDGKIHPVTSSDVNNYLKEITGQEFTAKDFRTWAGTVLAAIALQEYARYDSKADAKKNVVAAIERVAKKLGNTPAICRKCYIHPDILNAYLDGSLIESITQKIDSTLKKKYDSLSDEEILVLAFLKKRLSTTKQ